MYILYALGAVITFSFCATISVRVSRSAGSLITALLRQLWILIVGLPIIFIYPEIFSVIISYYKEILASGVLGALYLFTVFKGFDYIEVLKGQTISVITRILSSILIGIILLEEIFTFWDLLGVLIILGGISMYLFLKSDTKLTSYKLSLGLIYAIISGILFVSAGYCFALYAKDMSPVLAGYILEISPIPFLTFILLVTQGNTGYKCIRSLSKEQYLWSFLGSAPVLFGSFGLALAYTHLDFIIVNIIICSSLIFGGVFSWILLGEKLSKLQIFVFSCILFGIFIVNIF